MQRIALLLLLSLSTLPAHALEVGPVVYLNIEGGGDSISTPVGSLSAGGGVTLAAGMYMDFDQHLSFLVTYGYKANSIDSEDFYLEDDVSFSRWPLDALVMFNLQGFRIGGGTTLHYSPKENFDVVPYTPYTVEYKTAQGYIFQWDKVWHAHNYNPASFVHDVSIGFRVTFIDYESKDGLDKFNGNSLGLSMSATF